MRLIVGIGNPGAKYEGTRHNVGFRVLDLVAKRQAASFRKESGFAMTAELSEESRLMKPLTFVNRTGRALARQVELENLTPTDILIVVDDVHLPLGRLRLKASGSSGGHNGLKDIEQVLGTRDYPRLRFGVDGEARAGVGLVDFVLSRFDADEWASVNVATLSAALAVIGFAEGIPFDQLMEQYNREA